ncbi:MAG: hypothetical protein ACR2KT_11345 [Methylocella sp.]|nr:MAG: hypothetical protein DLM68_00480 [Hyphomicrobiales bacterium]
MSLIFHFGAAFFIPNNCGTGADSVTILPTPATSLLLPFLLRERSPEKFSEPAIYFIALGDEVAENGVSVLNHLMRSSVECTSYVGSAVSNIEVRHDHKCAR